METLAEDLLLLALDDDEGIVSWHRSGRLYFGLGGAVLIDLALLKRIDYSSGRIIVIDPTPTGDEILDATLEVIRKTRSPHEPRYWVRKLGEQRSLPDHLARQLVARGILREQDETFLFVFQEHRFPTSDPGPESAVRRKLREIVLTGEEPDTRSLLLLSLVDACGLTDSLFSRQERKLAKQRIATIVQHERIGIAVDKAVAEVTAAITAAITAASFTTVVGPGPSVR